MSIYLYCCIVCGAVGFQLPLPHICGGWSVVRMLLSQVQEQELINTQVEAALEAAVDYEFEE